MDVIIYICFRLIILIYFKDAYHIFLFFHFVVLSWFSLNYNHGGIIKTVLYLRVTINVIYRNLVSNFASLWMNDIINEFHFLLSHRSYYMSSCFFYQFSQTIITMYVCVHVYVYIILIYQFNHGWPARMEHWKRYIISNYCIFSELGIIMTFNCKRTAQFNTWAYIDAHW